MSGPLIAIIGGGPAGAICASALVGHGYDVAVYDKGRRAGGRLSTRDFGAAHFDHGAQYMTVRDPRIAACVERWIEAGVVAPWPGPFVRVAGGSTESRGPRDRRLVGVPGMSAVVAHLLAGCQVQFGARAVSITRLGRERRIEIAFADGTEVVCDRAVVAVPAPQAAPLLAAEPELSALMDSVEIAPCWAAMAEFDEPLPIGWAAASVDDDTVAWIARNHAKPGRPQREAWVVHASAPWSRRHLDDEKASVAAALVGRARAVVGTAREPIAVRAHRWRYALVEQPVGQPCLHQDGIVVCGDGLLGGRIEAALQSGLAAADRVFESLQ